MTFRIIAQVSSCIAVLALVGACATKPQVSSSVEAGRYLSNAGRTYTPPGPAGDPWGPYIKEASAKYDVPQRWIREVMHQESGGRLYGRGGSLITSGAGAMGLMQVMPATYDDLRARYRELGNDPFDPHNNIMAGTAYIREMYDIYGSPGFLAAYNAGPGRLDDYLTRNRTLPLETRRYVAAIGPKISGAEPRTPSPGAQFALNALPFSIPDGPRYGSGSRYSAPSVAPAPAVMLASVAPAVVVPVSLPPVSTPEVAAPPIVLRPQPVQMAEIPTARYAPLPASVATPPVTYASASTYTPVPAYVAPREREAPVRMAEAQVQPRVERVMPVPPTPRLARFEQLPEPPMPTRAAPDQRMMAMAALVPLSRPRAGFSLVTPASAEPIQRRGGTGFGSGGWAVQVGAFANEGLASSAAASARGRAQDVLGQARPSVTMVREPHGTLYRARLTGLSRDAAATACERLTRTRGSCMVISPDARG